MTVLVSDSFNRANSTTSLGTTDSYAGGTAKTWAVLGSGTYGIISNQAYAPSGSGHNVAYVDAGVSDVTITVTFAAYDMAGTGGAKIGLRIVDNENMINVQARTDGIVIYYYSGGSSTTLNDTAGTLVAGDVIKVIASGTSIKAYRNGTLFSSATTTFNQTATKHGINAQTYPAARFDNFMIEDVVTPVALTSTVKSNTTQTATPTKTGTMALSSTVKSNTTQVGNLTKAGTFLLNSTVKSNTTQTSHVTSTTSGVLVSDSFNRADSTTTMGTPDNYTGGTISPVPVWTTLGTGAYGIISNQAYCPTQPSSGHNVAVVDVGVSNFNVEAQFSVIGSRDDPKIAIRVQDQENMLLFAYSVANGGVLYSYTGGVDDTPIFTWNGTIVNNDIIKVTANGSNITVYQNGTPIINATNVTKYQTATKTGIMAYHYQNSRFDNFKVSSIQTALTSTVKSNSSSSAVATKTNANGLPNVNKIVVVIMENHSESEIIGSSSAPYMNSLANSYENFTNYKAIEHPSEPNYFDIFSGSNQNIIDDGYYARTLNTANLYTSLNAVGKTFVGYSESMPSDGFSSADDGSVTRYVDKHNPWKSFSNVPATSNLMFTHFSTSPSSTDYSGLPDVSIVVPNLDNDIHDGTISQGDTWLQTNVDPYLQWAKNNNSLLIIVFDEDDTTNNVPNLVPFIMAGTMVKKGTNSTAYNHYSLLRTLVDLKGGSTYPGASSTAVTITDAWVASGALSSTVKSRTTSSANITNSVRKPLTSIVKSNSSVLNATLTITGTRSVMSNVKSISLSTNTISNVTRNQITSTTRSGSSATARITDLLYSYFIYSSVKSRTGTNNNLSVATHLTTNVTSRTYAFARLPSSNSIIGTIHLKASI